MKFVYRRVRRAPQLAMTSMMDVIFLLLCFFITVSVFSQWENEISIKLPDAATSEEPNRLPGEIVVNIARNGRVTVNSLAMSLDDLKARLAKISRYYPGQAVIIRADKDVRYNTLVGVIDACRAADVWNFSLATNGEMDGDGVEPASSGQQ